MVSNYLIAEKIGISLKYKEENLSTLYFKKEYSDFITPDLDQESEIGEIVFKVIEDKENLRLKELSVGRLYEDDNYLYMKFNGSYLRIDISKDKFYILAESKFEDNVLFNTVENLIRLYSHRKGIDFFHASSFIYRDKTYMLNGFGGSGKTEIMLRFLLKDAGYIADDLLIINEEAKIYPYRVTIPVNWKAVDTDFAHKSGVPSIVYDICKYCKHKNGFLTKRIFYRLAYKYLIGYRPHTRFTGKEAKLKYYNINVCLWLHEADFFGPFEFSNKDFFQYMNQCLKLESMKYCDLEGFLSLKFPIVKELILNREILREKICEKLKISGLALNEKSLLKATEFIDLLETK